MTTEQAAQNLYERAYLTADIPCCKFPLYAGDTGIIMRMAGEYGILPDRYAETIASPVAVYYDGNKPITDVMELGSPLHPRKPQPQTDTPVQLELF